MTAAHPTVTTDTRIGLRQAWAAEIDRARSARNGGDIAAEWRHLERAHILSQPMPVPHLRTHAVMFGAAWRGREVRELAGQTVRLLLAVPGSVSGRYPVGNTGGADVSAFRVMPIPDDLHPLLVMEDPR
jgi:hypothetical protein